MATKVRFKTFELLWIMCIVGCGVIIECRPSNENNFIAASSDPSDRTLVRVLRSEFEEEEKEQALEEKVKKVEKAKVHAPRIKKRASEEDQFFQALLSRANDKPVEKRSYESQPEKDDVHTNWKGDSKISDADKHELEHLFNSIGMVDVESKEKVDAKRATKPGVDGKIQELVEWLMAKPPKEFHDSLRHIIDVEREVSDLFAFAPGEATSTSSDALMNDGTTTTSETASVTETTSPVTTTTGETPNAASVSPPVSITAGTTDAPIPTDSSQTSSYATTDTQTMAHALPVPPATSQQTLPQDQEAPVNDGKKPNVYADVTQAAKTMSKTGPGPIPPEAMDYFNKFSGGVSSLPPAALANYGVHPEELNAPAVQPQATGPQQAPVVAPQPAPAVAPQPAPAVAPQQAPAVAPQPAPAVAPQPAPAVAPQPATAVAPQADAVAPQAPAVPQQQQPAATAQSAYSNQYQQSGYAGQYGNQYQNSYYGQYNGQQQADSYRKPYSPRGTGFTPVTRPYPMNRDELDEPTDKKNRVTATLLFKQNWKEDFLDEKSTSQRVFKDEVKRKLRRILSMKKHFKKIHLDKIREDRGKVSVTFTAFYKKKTKKPLEPLYDAIKADYLGPKGMPVYRDTLVRKGVAHLKAVRHRSNKMYKSQSENPATEFAKFAEQVDREMTGQNLPLNEQNQAYQGCYVDKKPNRDMRTKITKFEMTPEWCVHTCEKKGFRFAGVQYSYLCFCGNKFGRYGRVPDSECSSRCFGDKNRFCGAFWHNSIYSVDGQRHELNEFSAIPDDEPEEEEENEDERHDKKENTNKGDEKEHAEVANHLMEAASSTLKAAKKLLPGKNKRQSEKEFTKHKRDAEKSLEAVDNIVKSVKNVEKRSVGNPDGRNLLMAYLGNVGGYDREYRSVEDEDKPVEKIKFDYKRMIIDEEGDGEFVSKPHEQKKNQLRRNRRSLENEEYDGRKKMASRAIEDGDDVTNPKSAVSEPSRRELLSQDASDKEIKRESRDIDEEEEEEEEKEMKKAISKKKKPKTRKRSVGFDKSLYHSKVEEGFENVIGGVVDVMKGTSTIGLFKEAVERISSDVVGGLAVPEEQKEQVNSEVRADIKETGISRVNSLVSSIRTELNEYGEMHPAVGPQAVEAAKFFADIPLDQSKADEIKNKIRKRSVDEDSEEEDKEKSFLSDILREHFNQNN